MKIKTLLYCTMLFLAVQLSAQSIVICNISSTPSGARVYVDGTDIGLTPVQHRFRSNRSYEMVFKKSGYNDLTILHKGLNESVSVSLQSGTTQTIPTPPVSQSYNLTINGNVNGAEILIGDNVVGRVPLNITLQQGSYTITVRQNGYKSFTTFLNVNSNNVINAILQEIRFVTVQVLRQASVYLNGSEIYNGSNYKSNRPGWESIKIDAPDGTNRGRIKVVYFDLEVEKNIDFNQQTIKLFTDLR